VNTANVETQEQKILFKTRVFRLFNQLSKQCIKNCLASFSSKFLFAGSAFCCDSEFRIRNLFVALSKFEKFSEIFQFYLNFCWTHSIFCCDSESELVRFKTLLLEPWNSENSENKSWLCISFLNHLSFVRKCAYSIFSFDICHQTKADTPQNTHELFKCKKAEKAEM
jgi:hypothetical protein